MWLCISEFLEFIPPFSISTNVKFLSLSSFLLYGVDRSWYRLPCPGGETESLRVWGYFPVVLGDILFERAGEEVFGRGREGRNRMKDSP